MKNGPEERWEDRKLWEEERRHEESSLIKEEIENIKSDESYDDRR